MKWPEKFISVLLAILPNPLKKLLYKIIFKADIGEQVRIGFGTIIFVNKLKIGQHSKIGVFNQIRGDTFSLGSYSRIGDFNKITVKHFAAGSRAIINSKVDIRGDTSSELSHFRMGMHSWVFDYCYINVVRPITLGINVGVGGGSYIFTHGLWLSAIEGFPVSYGEVEIGDNVWIPWGCFIMPGVHIGNEVIIGARSLVNKDIPAHALAAGIPVKLIREKSNRDISTDEKISILKKMTDDFASKNRQTLAWTENDLLLQGSIEEKPFIAIHKQDMQSDQAIPGALNLIFGDPIGEPAEAWLSLNDYRSSSYSRIPGSARDWLEFGRNIGLRFYPLDEL